MTHPPMLKDTATILIADDNPNNLLVLSKILERAGYHVDQATTGTLAFEVAKAKVPDLILLDIMMPDLNGYDTCRCLKADVDTQDIPVIFLSALDDVVNKVKAFEVGGVDYITKPFRIEEVMARVKTHLNLRFAQAEIAHLNQSLEQRVHERTAELEKANTELQQEIAERRQAQAELLYMATHDSLTGLANRTVFIDKLCQVIQQARSSDYRYAVLFLDCDRFKFINDSFGHLIGDQLLIQVAKRLQTTLGSEVLVSRLGGDEFTILLENVNSIDDATAIAEKLHQSFQFPFAISQQTLFLNVSIGIVLGEATYREPETILRDVDIAMYRAKACGKGCYQVFDPHMHQAICSTFKLETDLRLAIERQEFEIYYQPIVSLKTGTIDSFEALIRWHHPEQGPISPSHFIPIAEDTGLILPIGLWVLEGACQQFCLWQHQGLVSDTATISVNLSLKQFTQPHLIDQIDAILRRTGLSGRHLKLEITESSLMENGELVTNLLHQLRQRHVQLSIDDFGTGYSSLSYLHHFPVNTLKIDRSFIQRISHDGQNLEIIRAITSLAHHLGMTITAEGIESLHQLNYLKKLGCEFGQGYLCYEPMAPNLLEAMLLQVRRPYRPLPQKWVV